MRFKTSLMLKLFVLSNFVILFCFVGLNFKRVTKEIKYSKCDVVHIGIAVTNYYNHVHFYTLLKSIFIVRTNPIHFHIIISNTTEKTVKTLFETWTVPQVKVNYYNINGLIFNWLTIKQNSGLLKLVFPKIIPSHITNKIIVIDPDLIFSSNLQELWNLFDNFKHGQFIGLPRDLNTNGFQTSLILYYLKHVELSAWNMLLISIVEEYAKSELSNQDLLSEIVKKNFLEDLYLMSCRWNIQERIIIGYNNHSDCHHQGNNYQVPFGNSSKPLDKKTVKEFDGNSLREEPKGCNYNETYIRQLKHVPRACRYFPESQIYKWRTLLFFKEFNYTASENDVTLVTQLSIGKLPILEEVARRWQGPMSVSIYLTDPDLHLCIKQIENSEILQSRSNIAYHAIFKEGNHHPINPLRNTALDQVITPYVFLNDMDLVPMQDMYFNIKEYISEMPTMNKKALVVPAFETRNFKTKIPSNKEELLLMFDSKVVFIMLYRFRHAAHGPSNYSVWRTAEAPYQINWVPKYEPYVVVEKNVTKYDERFFAYGWNKIAHIMELEVQNYEFFVLPNAFAVHKEHPTGTDKVEFAASPKYQRCLRSLKREWSVDIQNKYGRDIKSKIVL